MNNILVVSAHADDAEIMAGGTIIKWQKEGKKVFVVNLTDGELILPNGDVYRSKNDAKSEEMKVAEFIGYKQYNLGYKNLHLEFKDDIVVKLLEIINKNTIDTIIYPHNKDVHHDHEIASRLAIAVSRRVPNLLMGQINYFLNDFFTPNVFVDISDTWDKKIEALSIYKSQWRDDWYEFLDATSTYYGKIIGVERAEGFYSSKLKL